MKSDLIDCLSSIQDSGRKVTFTLSCKLGNPPEQQYVSKTGAVTNLDINLENPTRTSFYIQYPQVRLTKAGGGIKFKVQSHEIVTIFDEGGNILYESKDA